MGKHYFQEYRDYVSKLIVEEGRVGTEVAYELELSYKTISRLGKAYKKNQREPDGRELYYPFRVRKAKKQHEKELEQLREENEILKKAMHIFTKSQE